jgi:carboxylesterase
MKRPLLFFLIVTFLSGCTGEPEISDDLLDGKILVDQSLLRPEHYLVSRANPNPTPAEAQRPVILAVHGFSASTFEWDEFRDWVGSRTDFSISQVLMGGHGQDYASFKAATWQDWRQPIMEEYNRLEQAGYTNISLAGSSTGCAVLLEMLANGYFRNRLPPRHVFLVDPIVLSSDKMLSLIGIVGPLIGYTEAENVGDEKMYWYTYRPYQTLKQLREVINVVRKELQKGITLPGTTSMKVYKSTKDDVADPVSAVLIYKGVRTNTGQPVEVRMVPSDLHVITRLSFRTTTSATDLQNQRTTFEEIAQTLLK